MKTQKVNIHSQQYMETMARLMSEALESPEGLRALAAAIAAPIEQEIKRKEISSLLLTKHTLPKGEVGRGKARQGWARIAARRGTARPGRAGRGAAGRGMANS